MPRNMSFFLTKEQVRDRSKTVTRRRGWWFLQPGDIVQACEKCQGLKKGEKIKKLAKLRIVSTRPEPLAEMGLSTRSKYGRDEAAKEGFPELTGPGFVAMFCQNMKCDPSQQVNRIEFEYLDH